MVLILAAARLAIDDVVELVPLDARNYSKSVLRLCYGVGRASEPFDGDMFTCSLDVWKKVAVLDPGSTGKIARKYIFPERTWILYPDAPW